jgi:hypothetical protein
VVVTAMRASVAAVTATPAQSGSGGSPYPAD